MSDTERSQFESESGQVIVKQIGAGLRATVFATIDKAHADSSLVQYRAAGDDPEKQKTVLENVRTNLSAAKVGRVDWRSPEENNNVFRQETEALHYIYRSHRAFCGQSILQRITPTGGPASRTWFMMEMLSKGTMHDMRKTFYHKVPLVSPTIPAALLWHMIASLCEALQFLHFGIVNGEVREAPTLIVHGDLHGANILFRYPGQYRNFPDVVVADFGQSKSSPPRDSDDVLWRSQVRDLQLVLNTLMTLIRSTDGDVLNLDLASQQLDAVRVTDNNQHHRDTLAKVVAFAKRQREKKYVGLPASWAIYFSRPPVSDEDLHAFFRELEAEREETPHEAL